MSPRVALRSVVDATKESDEIIHSAIPVSFPSPTTSHLDCIPRSSEAKHRAQNLYVEIMSEAISYRLGEPRELGHNPVIHQVGEVRG